MISNSTIFTQIIYNRDEGINIHYFSENVFRASGEQTITGKWTIAEVNLQGPLDPSTKVNGLNLATDLVNCDDRYPINITGIKTFSNLTINRLICDEPCIIKNIDIEKWFDSFANPNQKNYINGKLTVNNLNATHIITDRPINGIIFNSDTILTKNTDQIINSNITAIEDANSVGMLIFKNLTVNTINSKPIDFLNNIWKKGDIMAKETQVTFIQPIVVGDLNFDGQLFGIEGKDLISNKTDVEIDYIQMNNELYEFNLIMERTANFYESKFNLIFSIL